MTFESFHHMTIGELLTAQANHQPDRPFVRMPNGESCTYADVERQASALAAGLRGLGLRPGDRLAIILPNIPQFVLSIFAAAKAGLIICPVNVRRRKDEALARLAKTRPAALVTDAYHVAMARELRDDLFDLKQVIALEGGEGAIALNDLLNADATLPAPTARPDAG